MRHNAAQCGTICGKMQHTSLHRKSMWHITRKRAGLWKTGRRNFAQVLRGVEVEDIGCGEQKVRFPQEQTRFQDRGRRANISSKSIERWSIVLKVGKGGGDGGGGGVGDGVGGGVGGGICGWMLMGESSCWWSRRWMEAGVLVVFPR